MVNKGRPSKDCVPCRKRKLRCDLRRPGCGQCQRARISCHGYPEPGALIVRDETGRMWQKAGFVLSAVAAENTIATTIEIPRGPDLDWEVRSRDAFFSFYVYGLSRATHETLPPLYHQAAGDSPLSLSVDAVSLASTAHKRSGSGGHHHKPLLGLARRKYTAAVGELNRALRSTSSAVEDATLQAVLLLDLYEKIMASGDVERPLSRGSWMAHINGAMALVKARGHANVASHTARRLAARLVTTLLISCHATMSTIPTGMIQLCQSLDPFVSESDIKWQVNRRVVGLINLKADIYEGRLCSDTEIVDRAMLLESDFAHTERRLSPAWEPVRRVIVDSAASESRIVWGDYYDIHTDHAIIQAANVLRAMWTLLINIILDHLVSAEKEAVHRYMRWWPMLAQRRERLARDICASIPQFLLPEALPTNSMPFSPLQTLQCYAVLSPLYVSWLASEHSELRSWVVKTMKHMGVAGDMTEARKVADALEKSVELPFWTVYSIMGSYVFAAQ